MSAGTAILIPCFNEEKRLDINAFLTFSLENPGIDLWFCNDGSTDGTISLINQLREKNPANIFLFSSEVNKGKAGIIRLGMQHLANNQAYTFVGFIDADLSAPLAEILHLMDTFQEYNHLAVVTGVRVKLVGKLIRRNVFRYYLGRIFTTYYDTLLNLSNYDTQCGLKIFRKELLADVFDQPFSSKWLFDVEIFLRIKHLLGKEEYEQKVREEPLDQWIEIGGSKLRIKDFLVAPIEILKIYFKYRKQIHR